MPIGIKTIGGRIIAILKPIAFLPSTSTMNLTKKWNTGSWYKYRKNVNWLPQNKNLWEHRLKVCGTITLNNPQIDVKPNPISTILITIDGESPVKMR